MKLEKDLIISHYKILSEIGKGGMGEVYLAEDTKLDRKVAVKFLNDEFSRDADKLNRFVREAKAASALNHPNILTVYEIGENDGTNYIAAEFIDGKDLTHHISADKISLETVLDVSLQIVSALKAAHEAGIVHRDIKPDNVMIRRDGIVKVLDFGLAKLAEKPESDADLDLEAATIAKVNTVPGVVMGTPNYMSPEQARGKDIDNQTDIFSFGIVLYEMLTRKLPFAGDTISDIIAAILTKEPKPLEELNESVPDDLREIVKKTLEKDKSKRYQTADELLEDLKRLKKRVELDEELERTILPEDDAQKTQILNATTIGDEVQTTAKNSRVSVNIEKSSLNRMLLAIAGIIAVAAIGLGYWYFSGGNSKQIESIAVMPFVNESGNADVEYLSDGMTETLIKSLSNLPNLNVKPRSTVFRYKGTNTDLQTIAKELNVQAILNGRVVQRGDDLTLSLELIDAAKDSVIWTESYQRKQTNLVSLQSEIARDVSTRLKSKLSGAEEEKVANAGTTNAEAYQAYLKGRYYWNRRTAENIKRAIEQFKIAADKDPNYALAYAGLADCFTLLPEYAGIPMSEAAPQAKEYARRAIEINDRLGEPHAALGLLAHKLWQWEEAEKEFKRAIEINPNYATAYHWYSILLKDLGRYDEAAKIIKRAAELDPLSGAIGCNISMIYLLQDKDEASMKNSLKMIELDPTFGRAYEYLGLAYLKLGRKGEAVKTMEKAVELTNKQNVVLSELGYVYGRTGKRAEAIAVAKELEAKYARNEAAGHEVAAVYSGLGEKDKAFEWLEKDFQNRDSRLTTFRWETQFEPLRDDPRFKDLLRRMNLPE